MGQTTIVDGPSSLAGMSELSPATFGFQKLVGFEAEKGEGTALVTLEIEAHHLNPNGVVHGGVAYAMMDTAMGRATMSLLDDDKICATIEMQVRYFRGVSSGRLNATATVINAGRRIVHVEARTVDGDGRLIASSTSSYAVLEAPTSS